MMSTTGLPVTAALLLLLWLAFAAGFVLRTRTGASGVQRREPRARFGIALQAVGYALVWFRRPGAPSQMPPVAQWAGLAIGASSVLLVLAAVRHLGRQWSVQARIVDGHQLIVTGPYAWVRHPIYAGMLGMLVATGAVLGTPARLAAAVPIFLGGTRMRTDYEEGLLRQEFGETFEEYRRRVGWLFPGL